MKQYELMLVAISEKEDENLSVFFDDIHYFEIKGRLQMVYRIRR